MFKFSQKTKRGISFYNKFLRNHYLKLFGVILVTLFVVIITLIEPYLYKSIINVIENGTHNTINQNIKSIINLSLIWIGIQFIIVNLTFIKTLANNVLFREVWQDILDYAVNKTFNLDIGYHIDRKSGETGKIIDEMGQGTWMISWVFFETGMLAIMNLIFSIVLIFYLDYRMAIISLSAFPIYIYSTYLVESKTSKKQETINKIWNKSFSLFYETISNMVIVKAFAKEKNFVNKIHEKMYNANWMQYKVNIYWAASSQLQAFSMFLSRLAVIGGGAYFATQGTLTIGEIAMFSGYLSFLYAPIQIISNSIMELQKYYKWYQKGLDIVLQEPKVKSGMKLLKNPKGRIEFKNVSFKYAENKYALKNISFTIEPGETVALVGHSGSGKTTTTQLIQRFYDTTSGNIYFDQINTKDLDLISLRENIGIVFQDSIMFHDTIEFNVRIGKIDATKEEVIEACKKAQIHEYIMGLKDGYKAKIGERGVKLSGGQRQRIAIARAIIKNPALIIFDEATSALDSKTEKEVQGAIKNLTKDKSTLIIAHRLSTITHADKIIVMDQGKIIDSGTHKELLTRCNHYKELVQIQAESIIL